MSSQFRAVFHLRLLGIPDPQRAVCGAGSYEVAGWVPGDGADAGEASGGWRVCEGLGLWTYVRVGAWASRGGVVVCLDFEGWEEGGEAVFGYGSSRVGWGHCEGSERRWGDAKDFVWLQDLASGVAERMRLAQ